MTSDSPELKECRETVDNLEYQLELAYKKLYSTDLKQPQKINEKIKRLQGAIKQRQRWDRGIK